MKQLALALSLAGLLGACQSTSDINSTSADVVTAGECCAESGECCSESSECCSESECSSEAKVCPVTGAVE